MYKYLKILYGNVKISYHFLILLERKKCIGEGERGLCDRKKCLGEEDERDFFLGERLGDNLRMRLGERDLLLEERLLRRSLYLILAGS
jgi:hypothetical protein